jgi:hypothetical protein
MNNTLMIRIKDTEHALELMSITITDILEQKPDMWR